MKKKRIQDGRTDIMGWIRKEGRKEGEAAGEDLGGP